MRSGDTILLMHDTSGLGMGAAVEVVELVVIVFESWSVVHNGPLVWLPREQPQTEQ